MAKAYLLKAGARTGEVINVEDNLEQLQSLVGGWIEVTYLPDENGEEFTVYLNEEGKLIGLLPNIFLPYDVLVGDLVFTRYEYDEDGEGATVDLTDEDIEFIRDNYR